MLNSIVMALIVLVAVAVTVLAQDLDSPRRGTAASESDVRPEMPARTDLFSLALARLLAAEANYLADRRQSRGWEIWWEFALPSSNLGPFFTGFDLQRDLSPAEFAAFREELFGSAARLSAVGLN